MLLFQKKKWGMKRDFLTSFAPSQKSCHRHSFLHQRRKYLAGAATGRTLGAFFCESKWRIGERQDKVLKKINSFQGKLQSLCSCWMFYGKFLCSWDTSWKSVVCYKCSIRAVFHSAFCFAPIVLMKDTNGKCVSHVYGLLWSPRQWRPMRHHHSPSTSIISGWCWCPYWWHLITQEEVQSSLT